MRKRLKLSLPIPPSINHMYVNTSKGGKRLTKDAESYVRTASALLNEAIFDQKWKMQMKGTWIYIDMVFYFPDKRIRDASNCLKLLLDVMEGKVYENDMYALPRIQSVRFDKENPRLEISIMKQE